MNLEQSIKPPPTAAAHSLTFPPLALETRETVTTECAAYHLNRKPQTLQGITFAKPKYTPKCTSRSNELARYMQKL